MFGIGLFDECIESINKWLPKKKYSNEPRYRNDLMDFLNEKLNNSNGSFLGRREKILIKREHGRGVCDIAVGDRSVAIELKRDLKSKSDIDRLKGQIDNYLEDFKEGVIVVLVGNVNEYIQNDLGHQLVKKMNNMKLGLNQARIKVINKSHKQKTNDKSKLQNNLELNLKSPF